MRLQLVLRPDALNRDGRDAGMPAHRANAPAGSTVRRARRLADNTRRFRHRDRSLATAPQPLVEAFETRKSQTVATRSKPALPLCSARSLSWFWRTIGSVMVGGHGRFVVPAGDCRRGGARGLAGRAGSGGFPAFPVSYATIAIFGCIRERAAANLSRLWTVQISVHSLCTCASPRRRNWRKPRACLICPNTGSTTCLRNR